MTILAVSIYKETKHVKDGIQLSYTPHSGATRIRNIAPGSLFAHSKDAHLLQPGIRIVSVNNIQCDGQSASQVAQFIRASKGIVTVLVDDEITIYVEGSSSTTDISQDSIVHATIVSTASTVATSALTPTPSTTPAEPAMATPVDTTRTNPEVLDTVDTAVEGENANEDGIVIARSATITDCTTNTVDNKRPSSHFENFHSRSSTSITTIITINILKRMLYI